MSVSDGLICASTLMRLNEAAAAAAVIRCSAAGSIAASVVT